MEHPERDAWPAVLANSLNLELVNLARNGTSNRRMIRTLVELLPAVIEEKGCAPEEIMTLVSWTETSRHEYYTGRKRSAGRFRMDERFHDDWQREDRFRDGWQRIGSWRVAEGDEPTTAFYEHLWNDNGQLASHFLDWAMMDALLRDIGVQPRYSFTFMIPRKLPPPALAAAALLPQERTFGGVPPRPGTCYLEHPKEFPRAPGGHPLEQAARWFAGQLEAWLRNDTSLELPSVSARAAST